MSGNIEDADIVVDLTGGKELVKKLRERIKQLQNENTLIRAEAEAAGSLLLDVQQDCIKLRADNERLRKDIFEMNDKCVAMRRKLEADNKRLKEEYKDYEYLCEIADQDECKCDTGPPWNKCLQCTAAHALNECGEIAGEAICKINQALKGGEL